MAKVGARHLGRDREHVFWGLFFCVCLRMTNGDKSSGDNNAGVSKTSAGAMGVDKRGCDRV